MSSIVPGEQPQRRVVAWREVQAGFAGTLINLAPALTMGLLAFAALGPRAAAVGIPAALLSRRLVHEA